MLHIIRQLEFIFSVNKLILYEEILRDVVALGAILSLATRGRMPPLSAALYPNNYNSIP